MGQLAFGLCLAVAIMALPFVLFIGGVAWSTEKPIRGYLLSVIGAVLSLAVLAEEFGFAYPTGNTLLATAIVCGVACIIAKIANGREKKKISAPRPTSTVVPFSDENYADPEMFGKATADYEYIASAIPNIKNEEIAELTEELHQIATNIFEYLNHNPERMPVAKEFVNYYQDRTAELLKQYSALRATGIRSEALAKLERDMITTFRGFVSAYEKQFAKVIDADILSMDAEMKVARQVMSEDGINCEARVDYEDIHKTLPKEVQETLPKPEQPKGKGINLKYIGAAASVVLGVFGAYKFFGNKSDK